MALEKVALDGQRRNLDPLEELVERFAPLVESLARRFSSKGGSYEDLKQEGFLTLIKLFYRYRPGNVRLEGYLKRSLEAHLKSYWLKELNWIKRVLLNEDLPYEVDPVDLKEKGHELSLSVRDRSLLELYYLWGYNDRQIAERLGVSRSWVNLRRRRLIESLRASP